MVPKCEEDQGYPDGSDGLNLVNQGDLQVNEELPRYLRSKQINRKRIHIEQTFKDVSVTTAPKISFFNTYIQNDFKAYYSRLQIRHRSVSISKQTLALNETNQQQLSSKDQSNYCLSYKKSEINSKKDNSNEQGPVSKLQVKRREFQFLRERIEKQKNDQSKNGNKKKQQLLDDLSYYKIFADKQSRLTQECADKVASIQTKKKPLTQYLINPQDPNLVLVKKQNEITPLKSATSSHNEIESTCVNTPENQLDKNSAWKQIYDPTIELQPFQLRRNCNSEINTKQISLCPKNDVSLQFEQKTIPLYLPYSKEEPFSIYKNQRKSSTLLATPRKRAFSLSKIIFGKNEESPRLPIQAEDQGSLQNLDYLDSQSQSAKFRTRVFKSTSQKGRPSTSYEIQSSSSKLNDQVKPFEPSLNNGLNFQQFLQLTDSKMHKKEPMKNANIIEIEKPQNICEESEIDFTFLDPDFLQKQHVSHKSIMYAAKVLKTKFGIIRPSIKPN